MNHEKIVLIDEVTLWLEKAKKDALALIIKEMNKPGSRWSDQENVFTKLFNLSRNNPDPYLSTLLGIFYKEGFGTEIDLEKAKKRFEIGCEHNLSFAQYALADMFFKGKGVKKNPKRGLELCELAIEQSLSIALIGLGLMFIDGDNEYGIKKNQARGLELLQKAASQESSLAQYTLAMRYLEGTSIPKDIKKGTELLKQAAEKNQLAKALLASKLLVNDDGIELNTKKAIEMITSLAEESVVYSQYQLGMFYLYGAEEYEITRNAELGLKWLICASEQEHDESVLALAEYYKEVGNIPESVKWYGLLAKLSTLNDAALESLLFYHINHFDISKEALFTLFLQFETEANAGGPIAQCNLAFFLQHGIGVEKKNLKEAVRLYQLSAAHEATMAEFTLASFYKIGNEELPCSPAKALEYFIKAQGGIDVEEDSDDEDCIKKAREETWVLSETLNPIRAELDSVFNHYKDNFLNDLRVIIAEYAFDPELLKARCQQAKVEVQSYCFFSYNPTERPETQLLDDVGMSKLITEYAKITEIEEKESVNPS